MQHPSQQYWEQNLENMINELDDFLENKYGNKYRLHPARANRGETAIKAHDGLFDIVASFTLGMGSQFGRGYIVDVHLATLEKVPPETIHEIKQAALKKLKQLLPRYFPDKNLTAEFDGDIIKIHGDLSLGTV